MLFRSNDDMGEWFLLQGGRAWAEETFDHRGRRKLKNFVQYGKAKPSYGFQDGTGHYLIRFDGADASTASMFLLKFIDQIQSHNLKEAEQYV